MHWGGHNVIREDNLLNHTIQPKRRECNHLLRSDKQRTNYHLKLYNPLYNHICKRLYITIVNKSNQLKIKQALPVAVSRNS